MNYTVIIQVTISCVYHLNKNNCMLYPPPEVCHIHGFIVILFFSVKSDFIRVRTFCQHATEITSTVDDPNKFSFKTK